MVLGGWGESGERPGAWKGAWKGRVELASICTWGTRVDFEGMLVLMSFSSEQGENMEKLVWARASGDLVTRCLQEVSSSTHAK